MLVHDAIIETLSKHFLAIDSVLSRQVNTIATKMNPHNHRGHDQVTFWLNLSFFTLETCFSEPGGEFTGITFLVISHAHNVNGENGGCHRRFQSIMLLLSSCATS